MSSVRFTTWVSERERAAIDEKAQELGTSANFIVRKAIRIALGIDRDDQMLRLSRVTAETPNRRSN